MYGTPSVTGSIPFMHRLTAEFRAGSSSPNNSTNSGYLAVSSWSAFPRRSFWLGTVHLPSKIRFEMGRRAIQKKPLFRRRQPISYNSVKGGVKLDHQGGAKLDHYGNGEGFVLLDLRGWLERRPAPPLGGAFRPEWKAPLQIVATCRQGKSGTTFGGQASWGASACFP